MEEQISIIDLFLNSFSLEIIDDGLSLKVSWAFFFFSISAILCYKGIRNKLRKNK